MSTTDELFQKAREAVERANLGYAIKMLREVLRQDQQYPDARNLLRAAERRRAESQGSSGRASVLLPGSIAVALKARLAKGAKRLEAFEDFLESHPNAFWAVKGAADAAEKAGYAGEAINLYKDALRLKADDKHCLRALGDLLVAAGQHQEALKYVDRLRQLMPRDADLQKEVRDLSATHHMAAHKMEEAESFRDLIRDKELARKLETDQRRDVTMDDLRRRIPEAEKDLAEHPGSVNRILGLAKLYRDTDQVAKAMDLLREGHKAMPDNFEVREALGDLQLYAYDQAIARTQKALDAAPTDAAAEAKLEELRLKRAEFAVREFEWRLEQHPTDRQLDYHLGCAYYDSDRYNDAIASFQRAAQDARFEARSWKMLGLCFIAKGQHDLALEQFANAIGRHAEMDEEGKELRYWQAQAYENLGDAAQALAIYKKVYSQDINYRDVAAKVESLSK